MYAPQLGRFCSRDPLTYIDGYSLFLAAFVPNSQDPFGLQRLKPPGMFDNPFDLPPLSALSPIQLKKKLEELKKSVEEKTVEVCKKECEAWLKWDARWGDDWLVDLPKCPCDKANINSGQWQESPGDKTTHPGCSTCFRSTPRYLTVWPPVWIQAGQQCCYDEQGKLITSGPGAGTPDRRSPGINIGGHFYWDVYPYLVCKKAGMLDDYISRRPNDQGADKDGKECPKNPTNIEAEEKGS